MSRKLATLYVIQGNTDQTEGRGQQVDREIYTSLEVASKRVVSAEAKRKWGVMGVTELDLFVRNLIEHDDHSVEVVQEKLYGYRKDWQGKWNYGWMDNRDAPVNDPDYAEWLRLNKKFGVQR